jgi:hypothetical protein
MGIHTTLSDVFKLPSQQQQHANYGTNTFKGFFVSKPVLCSMSSWKTNKRRSRVINSNPKTRPPKPPETSKYCPSE